MRIPALKELYPREIAPGWRQRWTRQSWVLLRRAPLLFLGLSLGFLSLIGMIPGQNSWPWDFVMTSAGFLGLGVLQNAFRSADHHSPAVAYGAWRYFWQTKGDLGGLMLVAGVYVTSFGAALALLGQGWKGLLHPPAPMGFYWGSAVSHVYLIVTTGFFWPGIFQLVYLTLRMGSHPRQWLNFGQHSCFSNKDVLIKLLMPGMMASFLFVLIPVHIGVMAGLLLLTPLLFAIPWFGCWMYLFCREMYEGVDENIPQTAHETQIILNVAPTSS